MVEAGTSRMGHEEDQLQKDALPSMSTSGSGASSVAEGDEEMEAFHQEHSDSTEDAQDQSPSFAERVFTSYRRGNVVFWRGNLVLLLARLPSHLTADVVKVVPAWIQQIYEEEVALYCRYGFLRVSESAILTQCHSWTQETLDQMKAARTMGWNLEQLPLAKEVFPGSLLQDRRDNSSHPGSSEPSSSSQSPGQPSSSSPRQSTSRHASSREVCRSRPHGSHHSRNQAQGSRSSFSGAVQHDQVDQRLQGPTMAPPQHSLQGDALMPSIPPAFSGYPAQPFVPAQHLVQAQPLVQAPTVLIAHSWSVYPLLQGPSQTWHPQYSMPGMPYGSTNQHSQFQ